MSVDIYLHILWIFDYYNKFLETPYILPHLLYILDVMIGSVLVGSVYGIKFTYLCTNTMLYLHKTEPHCIINIRLFLSTYMKAY